MCLQQGSISSTYAACQLLRPAGALHGRAIAHAACMQLEACSQHYSPHWWSQHIHCLHPSTCPLTLPPTTPPAAGDMLARDALMSLLQSQGEPLSEDELHVALAALTGAAEPLESLPEMMGPQLFCADVLGLAAAAERE